MEDIDKEIDELKKMLETYKQAYIKCMGAMEYLEKKKSEQKEEKKEEK